jgi:rhomboid protease GluP
MFERQTTGSVVCPSCGRLVGVRDAQCLNCGRRNPGMWGFTQLFQKLGRDLGFGPIVIGTALVLYLLGLAADPSNIGRGGLFSLLSPGTEAQFLFGASGSLPVFGFDRWWTVLSAGWLHGGLLHIGFNLYWVKQLSPAVAHLFGPGRSVLIFLGSSVVGFGATSIAGQFGGFLPSFLTGATITVGASAAIFGWLGALIYYGRRTGSSSLSQQMLSFAVPLFVLGLLLPMVDNWAHLGGFGGGWLLARWLDPLRPERIDHVIAAVVGYLLSLVAVVVSVLHGLQFLR